NASVKTPAMKASNGPREFVRTRIITSGAACQYSGIPRSRARRCGGVQKAVDRRPSAPIAVNSPTAIGWSENHAKRVRTTKSTYSEKVGPMTEQAMAYAARLAHAVHSAPEGVSMRTAAMATPDTTKSCAARTNVRTGEADQS